ncbi:hypothetical protein HCN44_000722 [Aphidius gifuensis]|uniref:Uncharacterized protein n=1 Tax=Aphidius gifuensis TaxID=684658 RepID=A0A835CP45_APHGI|nr:uncharacterized protein LOC122853775 [Aphidius gifuensis]KAF7990917.1 hypothetical protein HCN44_000722 [Aphidius gifuensis]
MDQKKSNVKYSHLDQRIKTLIDVSQEVLDTDNFIEIAIDRVKTKTKRSFYPEFIRRSLQLLNREELFEIREKYWSMIAQMIINKMFPLSVFQSEYCKMLEETSSKDIDFYVLWMFKAEILKTLIIRGAHPLSELTTTTSVLKKRGLVGKLIGKLLKILIESEGELAFTEKWNASGIKWDDLLDRSLENSIDFIIVYDLHCLLRKGHNRKRRSATENVVKDELKASGIELLTDLVDTSYENQVDIIKKYNSKSLTIEETRQLNKQLLNLLRERDFDDIPSWITENVGEEK